MTRDSDALSAARQWAGTGSGRAQGATSRAEFRQLAMNLAGNFLPADFYLKSRLQTQMRGLQSMPAIRRRHDDNGSPCGWRLHAGPPRPGRTRGSPAARRSRGDSEKYFKTAFGMKGRERNWDDAGEWIYPIFKTQKESSVFSWITQLGAVCTDRAAFSRRFHWSR